MFTNQALRWGLALGYTAFLIGYLLQSPGSPAVEIVAPAASPDWRREVAFTIGHIIGFGTLFVLWYIALLRPVGLRAALGACVIALMIGGLAEILQSQLPERSASFYDLTMNTIGILIAWVMIGTFRHQMLQTQRS